MSGRGSGGGRGHYKARGRGGNRASMAGKPQHKKGVGDYIYYLGTAKTATDYEKTTEYLINYIRKTYTQGNDIATALEDLKEFDLNDQKPKLSKSTATDADEARLEDEQLKLEFKIQYESWNKRKEAYIQNKTKAYAFLWEQCSKALQNKIESMSDFATGIKNNPIELLKSIKQHAMNFQEHKYEMCILADAFKALFNLRQKEMESLTDYTKRFKTARDVLQSHVGDTIVLSKVVKALDNYDVTNVTQTQKQIDDTWNQFLAYLYLDNCDKAKYGSLLKGLDTQQSLGNSQYPKTIAEAANVLSNHKIDNFKKLTNLTKSGEKEKSLKEDDEEVQLSFAMLEGKCYCCGKPGHKSPACNQAKSKPKEEWAINKAKANEQSHAQTEDQSVVSTATTTTESTNPSSKSAPRNWCATHVEVQFYQQEHNLMKEYILLDNQSSTSIFCNKDYVENIHEVSETLELITNGGSLVTNQKAYVPLFGEVWFSDQAITNIFSLHDMQKMYPVSYDSRKENAFVVELPHKSIKFTLVQPGLYKYCPRKCNQPAVPGSFIQTVEENKKFYTEREVQRARKARELYHALGSPSLKDFKAIITMNGIGNNPVTIEDIGIAEKIFGADVGTLKGKTTRSKPIPVVNNYIKIPRELVRRQHDIVLCIDTMKINGMAFISTISRKIMYRTVEFLVNTQVSAYRSALFRVFAIYEHAGFQVKQVYCDNEYQAVGDIIKQETGIDFNYATAQEHVPEAERNIRVIKERFRANFHRLPFLKLPRVMIKMLATICAEKLNYFPPKGGISPYYSPRMILHHVTLDYHKHCLYPFGTYVQAANENDPTNSLLPRTLDCLYMRHVPNQQGGHQLLHLPTGKLLTRRAITQVPITPQVIAMVHTLATQQGMPEGLKITSRTGTVLYDSSWIAGVDFAANADQSDEDDNSNEQESLEEDDPDQLEEGFYEDLDPNEIAELLDEANHNPAEVIPIDQPDMDNTEAEAEDVEDPEILPALSEEQEQLEDDDEPTMVTTRSGRQVKPPNRYNLQQCHLNTDNEQEYSLDAAKVIAKCINALNYRHVKVRKKVSFVESYSLKAGIKKFREKGKAAAMKEMQQLHDREVFAPIKVEDLTESERKKAMESLIFLVEKRDGTIKGRTCADGRPQRSYMNKEDAASPTVMTESILITATIDAHQGRDVMTIDIPNAFVQTPIEQNEGEDRITMRIRGPLVDMLLDIDPLRYQDYVIYEGISKVIYVQVLKALYGMLQSSLLFYKKFRKDLEGIGFQVNPYDPCVANRIVRDDQFTVTWHVDDAKCSHKDSQANDEFREWCEQQYGDPKIGSVKATRGPRHDYLAMNLDFSKPGKVQVDMTSYVNSMTEEFPDELSSSITCPWNENLFKIDENSRVLSKERAELFHTFVAKGLFLSKRGRPDIQPAIAFLTTRVKKPTEQDWSKLSRMINFLYTTKADVLTLSADGSNKIQWYLDAAFAVHSDMKSQTGAILTLGEGATTSVSTKQKINTRSSTEAELISTDDVIHKVMWTKQFLEAQGFEVEENIIYRDNQSTMKLEQNGKTSCGKRTRHFLIRYFYITDLIQREELTIKYCPTDCMIADYMTKPLTGAKFHSFRKVIMNLE
jgi:hypothetical protein